MLYLSILPVLVMIFQSQPDPAYEAYRAWSRENQTLNYDARAKSLFEATAEWMAKWPDSRFVWNMRRQSLLETKSLSPELWKQAGENLIRLSPPHTVASGIAYDWVTARVNLKDAEALVQSEIEWHDARPKPTKPQTPTLLDLVEEAYFHHTPFPPLCTLATAQIQLREFDQARATIARIRNWLDSDFKRYFDQDPLEAFPDYESKYYILSAQLVQAEGRNADALAFYQKVIGNPYYRREYSEGQLTQTRSLWKMIGGTDEGWTIFSKVPPLPHGVPGGYSGFGFLPWLTLDYKLPPMNLPGLGSRTWTLNDFEGKSTMVYLWASWCGPCWSHLPAVQDLHNKIKDRQDIQIITLSLDEDREKLTQFMNGKGYSFPVMVSPSYAKQVIPEVVLGQHWIVGKTGSIRLQRTSSHFGGADQAFIDEAIYKLIQVSEDAGPSMR